jgi:hypothetical protein
VLSSPSLVGTVRRRETTGGQRRPSSTETSILLDKFLGPLRPEQEPGKGLCVAAPLSGAGLGWGGEPLSPCTGVWPRWVCVPFHCPQDILLEHVQTCR